MPATLILFDIDGTLVNTAGAGRIAIETAFHEVFGVDSITRRGPRVRFAGMSDTMIFESLAANADVDASALAARMPSLLEHYLAALDRELARPNAERRALVGVPALLERLDRMPEVRLGLLTGNIEPGARRKLEPFGLNRFFPGGGFGSDHRERREIARIAQAELSRLTGIDFPAQRVVVVGDTEQDIDCAQANGFRAVAVETGFASRETLVAARPDVLLPDLSDIPRVLEAFGLVGNRVG